jgi:hypothetical protein
MFIQRFILLLLLSIGVSSVAAETIDQRIHLLLRDIGHEYLLQIGDTNSAVMPVEQIEGRYAVRFQTEFSYEPDLLIAVAFNVMNEHNFEDDFIVEVQGCDREQVVHSFKVSLTKDESLLPCAGRTLVHSCYVFYFTRIENPEAEVLPENSDNGAITYGLLLFFVVVGCVLLMLRFRKKRKTTITSELIEIGQYQYDQKGWYFS